MTMLRGQVFSKKKLISHDEKRSWDISFLNSLSGLILSDREENKNITYIFKCKMKEITVRTIVT